MQSATNSGTWRRRGSTASIANVPMAVALMGFIASGALLVAQNPAPTSTTPSAPTVSQPPQPTPVAHPTPTRKMAQIHKKVAPSAALPPAPAQPVAQTPPPEPPKPDWPVNNKPVPAKVTWDTQGLTINATNSSLDQILSEVATDTGAKLDGKVGDERVFGSYGPGPARDIIAQLLDGTAYNVVMVGDQGAGTPREIVLSNRPTGPAPVNHGAQNGGTEDESDYEQPQQPMPGTPPMRNGFGPQGMPPDQNNQSAPEERRAEMEQRMEQLRQQQQEQQQAQPQQPQPPPTPPQ